MATSAPLTDASRYISCYFPIYDLLWHSLDPYCVYCVQAIVEACRNYGVAFLGESEVSDATYYTLLTSLNSRTQKSSYQKLHVCEFDSNRKCMSVLVRWVGKAYSGLGTNKKYKLFLSALWFMLKAKCHCSDSHGQIRLLSKGAESSILPKCTSKDNREVKSATLRHINDYAANGLRTLAGPTTNSLLCLLLVKWMKDG